MEAHINRRDFLKFSLWAGMSITIPGITGTAFAAQPMFDEVDLVVVSGPSPEGITKAAVTVLGGMSRFVSRGDVVVVKPNIGWDRKPEQAANTNPDVVATIVKLCVEAGAKTVKVFDRSVNDPRRCYAQSGIAEAARAAGADVRYIDNRKFKNVALNGMVLKSWPLYTEILEADKIINLPIAKTHGLATLTMGLKNWMGIMGGRRGKIHQRLDESLVDIARIVRPCLTLLDAVRILTANGPQGGNLADVRRMNTVIAGTDQISVDAMGATLFGLEGRDLGYVRTGHEVGLGVMDLSALKIRKISMQP